MCVFAVTFEITYCSLNKVGVAQECLYFLSKNETSFIQCALHRCQHTDILTHTHAETHTHTRTDMHFASLTVS